VQQGRDGFGLGTRQPTWHKAIPAERKRLVVGTAKEIGSVTGQARLVDYLGKNVSSIGEICGRWKEAKSASSSGPPTMFFLDPIIFTSGLERIQHALYAKLRQLSGTSHRSFR